MGIIGRPKPEKWTLWWRNPDKKGHPWERYQDAASRVAAARLETRVRSMASRWGYAHNISFRVQPASASAPEPF